MTTCTTCGCFTEWGQTQNIPDLPDHNPVSIGVPANGLSILGQVLSLALASALTTGALSAADWNTFNNKQNALAFPLTPDLGGTGVANAVGSTLTLGGATTITTGGTLALGGFTLTVPATGTAGLLAVANQWTAQNQITVATAVSNGLIIKSSDNSTTKSYLEFQLSSGAFLAGIGQVELTTSALLALGGTEPQIRANTVDGADTTRMIVAGGGAASSSRGAYIAAFGNEHATSPGVFQLVAGQGGSIQFFTNSTQYFTLSSTGRVGIGSGATSPGTKLDIVGESNLVQIRVSGSVDQTNPVGHIFPLTTANTAVREALRLEARVSTAATGGANGFGVGQSFYAETATDGTNQPQGLIATYWVDATNATRKGTLALSAYDTAERKGIEIRANGTSPDNVLLGDTWWEGEGFGLPYASFYGNDIAWAQAGAVQNTWYEISDADITDGQLNLITHDGSGKLAIVKAGRYRIDYHLVAECSVANKQLQSGISVSGTEQNDGIDHETSTGINQQMHMASTAILDLAAGATIELSLRTTDAGTPDISVEHVNLSMVMTGGT